MSDLYVEILGKTWQGYTLFKPTFTHIDREPYTHGHVYIVCRETPIQDVMWLSQSIPVVCTAIEKYTHLKVQSSTFYRRLRGEEVKLTHHGLNVYKFDSENLEELDRINTLCQKGSRILIFTRSPQCYRFLERKD
jgi:hypothetical protein